LSSSRRGDVAIERSGRLDLATRRQARSSVDSSFFLIPLLMNELVKAVLALALSTAAAVWLLGVALHLWPDTGQLAYGNTCRTSRSSSTGLQTP
jgi:hypothetical protein